MQFAHLTWAVLQPQTKRTLDPDDYRLFPDEANDLPDDVGADERQWMLKLSRAAE